MPAEPHSLSISGWLRWNAVSRRLPADHTARVLEIGPGLGGLSQLLAERYPYIAVEMDETAARTASSRVNPFGGQVLHGDLGALDASLRADVVCAFEVIEHIEDDRAALTEWASKLTPGGMLILTTPAFPDRYGAWDVRVGHWRRYEAAGLGNLLREIGLTDILVQHYGGPMSFVLDSGRQHVARLYGKRNRASQQHATLKSGQHLQPRGALASRATRLAASPAALLERAFPNRGTALVAVGRRHTA